ncbi:MAG: cytochrome-c peroxidase [Sedimentisphaerales bacterium]|nr:cytochrome-c peroxidase [Sedimentisphaerales bacterium]
MTVSLLPAILIVFAVGGDSVEAPVVGGGALSAKESLGKKLFFDANLSEPAGQSCSTCHAAERSFADPEVGLPVSRGVRKERFGSRNDLPAAYASFSPPFGYDADEGLYVGGQFWDGRATDLAEQAKGPFVNELEMANPSEKAVVDKVARADYAVLFKKIYGADAFSDPNRAYDYVADAIAAYEKSHELNRFDSKYDFYLAGKVKLSEQELRGLRLFTDEDRAKCAECHPSDRGEDGSPPLFTDFTYDNLGAPKNAENPFYYLPKEFNPAGVAFVDLGLGGVLNKAEEHGKFKVPSLRNVAVTGPYFHNGIFKTLREVVVFYNTRDVGPWPEPEVAANVNRDELGDLGLTEAEVDDIVAFLHTLTDGYDSKDGK